MRTKRAYIALLILLTALLGIGYQHMQNLAPKDPVVVWLSSPPYSFDPVEFDADVHHVTSRPCLAGLVTQYRAGAFAGIIAESWKNDAQQRTWRFRVRGGLSFSNGEKITAEAVKRSLTRIAWIQHTQQSRSGFVENLTGISELQSPTSEFSGITVDGQDVVLSFSKSQPKLLETISFGLYSIVYPGDFDSQTGKWNDAKRAVCSGAYTATWNGDQIDMHRRSDFPETLRHIEAAPEIRMIWGTASKQTADLAMSSSLDFTLSEDVYDFVGPGATDVSIYYLTLPSWKHPQSPLNNPDFRRRLRGAVYKALESRGIHVVRSFLPTSIPGISEFAASPPQEESAHLPFSIKAAKSPFPNGFSGRVTASVEEGVIGTGGTFVEAPWPTVDQLRTMDDPNLATFTHDIVTRNTGLLVEDPVGDVRFMIQSKDGIRLPDPTGQLHEEAAKPHPDLSRINKILWDDAIVWPVTHYAEGLKARKGKFDFSLLNLSLPASDLSWIGIKH